LSFLLSGEIVIEIFAISYMMLSLFYHYYFYELLNPEEYYFLYNLGFGSYLLWFLTFILGFSFFLISNVG